MKRIGLLLLSIFLVLIIFVSTTYSVLFKTDTTEEQSYTAGVLDITSNAINDSLTLTNSLPISDSEGKVGTAYVFKIENVGNLNYQFDVKLLSTNTDTTTMINASYIKVMVNGEEPVTLSSLTNGIILSNRTLAPGDSLQVTLRVWLDENTPNTQIGKTFTAKITTTGQAIYTPVTQVSGREGEEQGNTRTSTQMISTLGLTSSLKSGTPDFSKTAPYEEEGTTTYTASVSSTTTTYNDPVRSGTLANDRYCYYDSYTLDTSTGKFTLTGEHSYEETLYGASVSGKYARNRGLGCATGLTNLASIWEIQSFTCVSGDCYVVTTDPVPDHNQTMSNKKNVSSKFMKIKPMVEIGAVSVTTDTFATIVTKQITAVASGGSTTLNTSEVGIYQTTDDLGTSYYFRGNVTNNYVKFGKNSNNDDMYWRIIRINGDGSIRMIYDGTSLHANGLGNANRYGVGTSKFNENSNDNAYIGFMYGDVSSDSYLSTHLNSNSSTIKSYLESWYLANIENTGYSSYLADAIYCNDREKVSGNGYGTEASSYGTSNSNFLCSRSSDKFSYYTSIGNGLLTYKVGLITRSEVIMAGGGTTGNDKYYLYNGTNYLTMSPISYVTGKGAYVGIVGSNGVISNSLVNLGTNYVRPVISLKSGLTYSGNGTISSPFTVS